MAESYRGLTVRIGGDTTGLQKALRAATSAASSTQSQLRRIGTALRLDPGSIDSARMRMQLLGDRATDVNARMRTMREAMRQLDARGIGRAAEETRNIGLRAEQARDQYNRLTAELASAYNQIRKSTGLDPHGDMGEKQLARLSDEARRAYDSLRELKGIDLSEKVNAQDAVRAMRDLGIVTDETADRVADLGRRWGEASAELDLSKEVAQYRDLQVEMRRTEAEAQSLAREITQATRADVNAEQFRGLNQQLAQADRAAGQLERQMRRADDALRLDPSDVGAAELKIRAMAEGAQVAQQRMGLLQEKLQAFRESGIDRASAAMANVPAEVERAGAAYSDLVAKVKSAEGALEDLRAKQALSAPRGGDAPSREYERLAGQVRSAEAALESLNAEARESQAAFETAVQVEQYRELQTQITETRAKVEGLKGELSDMGGSRGLLGSLSPDSIREFGYMLTGSLTPAIVGIGYSAISSADTLDSAFRDMKKTVDGTDEQFDKLRDSAVKFSTTHVTSADQMLEIQALGGQMGVATGDLESFAEVISNLDIATDINAEDAATQLGQLANITHMTSDEYSQFGDALVRLGNNAPSQESAIMDIAGRIGSMASIVGMSVPDILAWSNAIASTGQNSEAAGTAISNTMSDIETAVSSGGDSLSAFAEVAGMSAESFAETWNANPTQAMKSFIEGLAALDRSGGSADAKLEELGITGTRQKQAIMGLTQTIGGLDDSLKMSNDAWNGVSDQWGQAGDAAREAAQKSEGFSGALGKLQNIASAFASELGEGAAPIIEAFAGNLSSLSDAFQALPGPAKTATVAVGGVLAAAGPLAVGIGTVRGALGQLKGGVSPATRSLAEMAVEAINSGTSLAEVAAASKSTGDETTKLTAKQKLANAGMKLGGVAAGVAKAGLVGLAVGGVAYLISKWQEYEAHQKLVSDATKTFGDIAREAQGGAQSAADGIGEISTNAEEATRKLADLNNSTSDAMGEFYGQSATLDQYVDTINRLGGQSDLSATDQERLKNAVQGYNEITGDSVEVTDAARGALSKSTDEINKNADAWKRNAEMQVYQEKIKEYTRQRVDNETELAKALDNSAEKTKAYQSEYQKLDKYLRDHQGEDIGALSQTPEYLELVDNADKAKRAMQDAHREVKQFQDNIDSATTSIDQMTASQTALSEAVLPFRDQLRGWGDAAQRAAGSMNMTLDQLAVKLQESGVSIDTLKNMSAEDFAQLAEDCKGNVDVMAGVLTDFSSKAALDGMAAALGFANGMTQGQAQAVYAAMQIQNMSLEQFKGQVDAFGLAGAEQITAYAQALAAGDTTDVAALKALQATQGLDSYLGQYGVSGQQGIQAFIDAINSGDTWATALQKAQQATQGLDSQQGAASASGSNLTNSFNSGAAMIDTFSTGSGKGGSFASGLASAAASAFGAGVSVGNSGASGARSINFYGIGVSAGNSFMAGVRSIMGGALSYARDVAAQISAMRPSANAAGGIRLNAEGGIRAHARGVIATKAVPIDIVGEDGAEAIVPLTNRKYSQPFVDLIADGVNSRLGATIADELDRAGLAALADEYERHAARTAADAMDVTVSVDQRAIADAVARAVREAMDGMGTGTVINQSFGTKVVRSDADLYTAAPIIYRNAMREARGIAL